MLIKTEEYNCPFCGHNQKIKFIVEDKVTPKEGQACEECDEPFDIEKWSDDIYSLDEEDEDDEYELEDEEFILRHGFFILDEDDEYDDEYDEEEEDEDYEDDE